MKGKFIKVLICVTEALPTTVITEDKVVKTTFFWTSQITLRACLVLVAATCGMFKIPIEGIALILPIDHFCGMFRSAINVLGNALATTVVGKWEKR